MKQGNTYLNPPYGGKHPGLLQTLDDLQWNIHCAEERKKTAENDMKRYRHLPPSIYRKRIEVTSAAITRLEERYNRILGQLFYQPSRLVNP